jgi:acyl carrier protein
MSIEENIKNFILKNLYFAESTSLDHNASFLEEGIIDSMGALELVAYVESEFGMKVDMSEVVVQNFDSINKLANFIRRKLGTASNSPAMMEPVMTASAAEPAMAGQPSDHQAIPGSDTP